MSRMTSKQTLKERTKCKKQNLIDWHKQQDQFEIDNSGGFEKIYPLNTDKAREQMDKAKIDASLTPEDQEKKVQECA